ncbi:hypothetical protein [Streptomyces caatingaensis]|uniref:Uncharacterized protein n=1 Tax=Streptomyces caatingaensis TaxID=1678637 RepID=A0A0K9XK51_9ACTN|nr:hypothetical protein [Streptomyces caatingaensis]KNB53749.1 hypothetical protein AC230_03860 [Streptomyces caatingaensis]
MARKQMWAVLVVVATVLAWSLVMVTLGETAAIATLVPSLGLLVQQIVQAAAAGARAGGRTRAASADDPRDGSGETR